jgi:DNA repair protein RadC
VAATAANVPWVRLERDEERYARVVARAARIGPIRGPIDVYTLLGAAMAREDQEVACVVLLGTHGDCMGVTEIARGARDHVGFEFPDALRPAVVSGCKYVVLVHNHPTGSAVPSEDDGELTMAFEVACFECGLVLLDHDVLGLDELYSFREDVLWKREQGRWIAYAIDR